jgi:asparagine synthase (glutamine-hydrolysing)
MCGICGQFNFADRQPVEAGVIRKMTRTITHRGPDDEGYFIDGPVGLGFRRLSIIDLEGGHQPMSNLDKTVWVIFNGEIYNFHALRRELESRGHHFQTNSDTEVIVHGYREWGTGVFNQLNGMFGIAIWDVQKQRLILARDAMGIKLVYYAIKDSTVWFGSEIRPVLAALQQRPEVDPVALNLFLRYRYTPSPLTILKGVEKLAPGTMLIFENGQHQRERWYQFTPRPFSPMPTSEEAGEELLAIYRRAIKRHLISDVPVGLLLSGGIDSGLLLALMHEHGKDWPTFTVGYGQSFQDDELSEAEETAQIFGSRHTSVQLSCKQFEEALPNIVQSLEEPIAASSIVPMYYVCERARQDVKVVLIGQGPDELFGGYKRHLGVQYSQLWRSIPAMLRRPIKAAVHALPRNETLKRGVFALAEEDRLRRYQSVFSLMPGPEVDALFRPGVLPENAGDKILDCWSDLLPQMAELDELGGFQLLEMHSSLPDELLMYGDKLSMAHGLEVRVPYLDREAVEYVQRLDASFKVRYGMRKWLHRQVCESYLPKSILRRKKRGFAVNVVDEWFRGTLNQQLQQALSDPSSSLRLHFVPANVAKLLEKHVSGQEDHHKILLSLVIFESWARGLEKR